jgi:TRAP-type C4-dicarboxylate transport system permease small subunit
MCLTTVDVITRKFVPAIGGVTDSLEFTEYAMIVIVFCGFAFLESKKGHIRVDMFVNMMPKKIGKGVEVLMLLIGSVVLFFLTVALFADIIPTIAAHKGSQILHVPQWPFVAVCAVSILFYAITVFLHGIERIRQKEEKEEAAGTEDLVGF